MSFSFFDESFYLTHNSDVAIAVSRGIFASGQQHYELFGAKEERNPSADFNTAYYSFWNADARAAVTQGTFASVLDHFDQFGVVENRASNSVVAEFDTARYLSDNPDVAAAISGGGAVRSALEHYLVFGDVESRPAFTRAGAPMQEVQLVGMASSGPDM